MLDLDSWQEIFATMRKNRLRTALTGLGVFLGILILMIMVGFNRSLEAGVLRQMAGFATNAVFVWGQKTTQPFAGLPPSRLILFKSADTDALARLPEVEHLAPRNQAGGMASGFLVGYGGKMGTFPVMGDMPAFQYVDEPLLRAGRFLNDLDIAERRKVAVLGEGVVHQLFPAEDEPIGRYVQINGIHFQVVGVFGTRQTGQQADRRINSVHLPFSTHLQTFNGGDGVGWFAVTGRAGVSAAELETKVRAVLSQRHKIAPTDDMALGSWNTGKQFGKMQSLFTMMNLVMWFAGLMTLAAGVIGVVNIMLISVRERTKEIGVRKALGATPLAIVRMIVAEAVVLTSVAGYLGIVAGVAALEGWTRVIPLLGDSAPFGPPALGLTIAAAAGGVIVLFGALAGVVPAYHAAKIQPIEALRTE